MSIQRCAYDISSDVGMRYVCGHPGNKSIKCGSAASWCALTQSPFKSFWAKWDERYMNLAENISDWSKDPKVKVGAVVVDDYYVRGVGYNGFPRRIEQSRMDIDKNKITVHAEVNAILAAAGKGHTLYIWPKAPCCSCASYIIQAGLKRVVLLQDHHTSEKWHPVTALQLLLEAEVKVSLLNGFT